MAVHASKRRKLSHSPSPVEQDDVSVESGSQADDVQDDALSNDDEMEDADLGADDVEGEEDEDEDESEDEEEEETKVVKAKKNKSQKPKGASLEASSAAYTGGTFKSNMFKLQVDQMLQSIRPRQGKREATAAEALHKLKKQMDQIPSREAQPVRPPHLPPTLMLKIV